MRGLDQIKNNLKKYLRENNEADDLEKLERDEFVIDISTKN